MPSGLSAVAPMFTLPPLHEVFPDFFSRKGREAAGSTDPARPNRPSAARRDAERDKKDTNTEQRDTGRVCPICNRYFTRPRSLRIHLRSHTGERPFGCPHPGCDKHFVTKSNLTRHSRVHNKPQKSSGDVGARVGGTTTPRGREESGGPIILAATAPVVLYPVATLAAPSAFRDTVPTYAHVRPPYLALPLRASGPEPAPYPTPPGFT